MKVTTNTVYDILLRMRDYFQGDNPVKKYAKEEPLRSELFSSDQMEQQGKAVAASHKLLKERVPDQLLKRLADNEKVLLEVRKLLAETVVVNRRVTPAGEWFLDNFYLLEEQIVIAKKHFPKGYSQSLPCLANGPSTGLPRVYDIALEIISHSDGRVDLKSLSGFVAAYQTHTKLTLGELWAIPIMLRLALIENLRRVSSRIAMDKIDQNLADYWAELMMEAAEKNPKDLILLIADMARSNPPLDSPFVAELVRRLQGKGPVLAMPLTWVEQQLSESGLTSNELVHFENQKQAADQVSMSNSIGSLRFLGATDWREFVETLSTVDQILRQDINGVYGLMDFSTRDHYRHVIERIAKKSELSEKEVAEIVLNFAKENAERNGNSDRRSHVGYYLIDKGLQQTQNAARMHFSIRQRLRIFVRKFPLTLFIGSITLTTLILSTGMIAIAHFNNVQGWLLLVTAFLSLIASSHLAVMLVNWVITLLVHPKLLPRMDFSKGIPTESRALVVIPTMLNSAATVEMLVETLEVRFLANIDENLRFALLTDFPDASQEIMPEDDVLLQSAKEQIDELNQKYKKQNSPIFFLFHRPRKWNPKEKIWMGYERKRGKLSELNALLRGGARDCFSLIVGDISTLRNTKYIITLDTDTQLPREAAWKLTATMAHPLNKPEYNEKKQRVTEGYGILQPRVAVSLPRSNSSLYTLMHGNDTGLDPYTQVTSDVYQDLFGEGSFIGKGIYDLDIFEKAVSERFPENRILSHDLLEGCYARSGLLSDVQLYEEHPSGYLSDVKRRHRWIRGDWQVGGWMLPFVPGSRRRYHKNKLSGLSRWKIFDNIRRSLVPMSLTLLLLLGWTLLPFPWFWTFAVTAVLLIPVMITSLWHLFHKPDDLGLRLHVKEFTQYLISNLLQVLFTIACLPFEAWYTFDAIIRTNWRMIVSNKGLLEWTPSNQTRSSTSLPGTITTMWAGPVIAALSLVYLAKTTPFTLTLFIPLLLLWLASPVIGWWISLPIEGKPANLSPDQKIFLHKIARKTWSFFERFVTAEDNWLPPDNYQEHPAEVTAHRTSPTNIGLALLANLTAYDFGYISPGMLIERTTNTFNTLERMEQYQRHLYNWYDTQSLAPLFPRYISTVDSGNLAGHLLTLKQGLLELSRQKIVNLQLFEGLRTTLLIVKDLLLENGIKALEKIHEELDQIVELQGLGLKEVKAILDKLSTHTKLLHQAYNPPTGSEVYWWIQALERQIDNALEDILLMAPWAVLPDIPEKFADLITINNIPTLYEAGKANITLWPKIKNYCNGANTDEEKEWLDTAAKLITQGSDAAMERINVIEDLASKCTDFADMEYGFLYDKSKHLLRIGYNAEEHRRDTSYYDLLASEARLCNFVAISQGKLPQESWFALGRLLTNAGGEPILLSWSGSMFEYLMPVMVMPVYNNTLLDQTNKACVKRQMDYGKQRGVPWGISESSYNMVDANLNYQYRAFGVPGLGLKRGLGDDLVVAPYATMLALMIAPEEACANLEVLSKEGFEGRFGFYEAIDYTPARLPRGQAFVVVRSFMAHHQGMGFLSLSHLLLNKPMQRRFEAEPQFQASLLLLQERIPRATIFYAHTTDVIETSADLNDPEMRIIHTPNTATPEVQLLSNSKYQVMITNSGGGYSRWRDIAVTRWREDSTLDNWGSFCYIKDLGTGEYWSNTYHPTLKHARNYEAVFSQGHAEFRRRDDGFETRTEIVVSPEDDMEMRRVRLTNRSQERKVVEITSYAEIVLNASAADDAHTAFSNLFVQTEINNHHPAIVCTRRPRSVQELPPWMFHLMTVQGAEITALSYETDRSKFIGRGNTVANPAAMTYDGELSGSQGSVLDPILAIRYRVILKPNQTATIDMVYGIGENPEICYGMMEKYQDRHLKNRAFELSWTHSQVLLRQINATEADAQLYGRLASSIIYANPTLRAEQGIIKRNHLGQSSLWSYSISGDLPIILLRLQDPENIELVKQLVQAHAYWRLKGLAVDLVIWNEDHGSYRQVLHDQILGLITASSGAYVTDGPGGVFVRSADQISNEDRILFQTVARVILSDDKGTLAEQVNKRLPAKVYPPLLTPAFSYVPEPEAPILPVSVLFPNGLGGFSKDGKEYIITTTSKQATPAPWSNVIANADFGTVISESGSAYTWALNAHEFRLTPWNNDPVSDKGGEAFYIRDEETGYFWSPSPLPRRGKSHYITRHGFGYSVFEHMEQHIASEMWVYVDLEASIKFIVLKIRNHSDRQRKLSATGYMEWVLGDLKVKSMMHVVTETDMETGALFAWNHYNTTFTEKVAFFDVDDVNHSITTDRTEFIGRNGNLQNPDALKRTKLSGKTGCAMDPCAAIQVVFDLKEGEEREIVFRLGAGRDIRDARNLVKQFQGAAAAADSLRRVQAYWEDTLGAVQVTTPDMALNLLANGWLTYQTIACRLWGRSGYYQSGGAFGFRDQLQDVMSLMHTKPDIARAQILLCASRQFREGDVQHWWHPPTGRGVRTRCSDDYLWLPYAVSRYIVSTGDKGILNESVYFLDGRQLNYGEESYYDLPTRDEQPASLYQHCVNAIMHGLSFGEHGLPFIGSGDWNDGMDRVGIEGRGESVWLGFFLYDVLTRFTGIALLNEDAAFAESCKKEAEKLKNNIEQNAWDGEWYRRAYFDDGRPLGSSQNTECRIDSISQSWSILSGAGETKRSEMAMQAVDKYLVSRDNGIIQLLDPPFDKSDMNPGYIKGYVPGVRENGGQYTHAAIWTLMAFAALGDNEKVWELFSLVNPVNHGNTPELIKTYKVEPYVAAADVYAASPHNGRGGWTWYTGSAGWMYQFIVEWLLGLKLEGDKLRLEPCVPADWKSFEVHYKYKETLYHLQFLQEDEVDDKVSVKVDGSPQENGLIKLKNDGRDHFAEIRLKARG